MKKSNQKERGELARAIINYNKDVRQTLLGTLLGYLSMRRRSGSSTTKSGVVEKTHFTWRELLKWLRKLTAGRADAHDWRRLLSECQSLDVKEAQLSAIPLEQLRGLHTRVRRAATYARSLHRVLEKEGAPRWVLEDIPLTKTKGRT